MTHHHSIAIIIIILSALVTGCGDDSGGLEPDTSPQALTVTPVAGAPGTLLEIEGLDSEGLDPSSLSIEIGGLPAPVTIGSSGNLLSAVPLFSDDKNKQTVPSEPVDVVVFVSGDVAGEAIGAVRVLELPAADGSAEIVFDELCRIAEKLSAVSNRLSPEPGTEAQYTFAVDEALTELLEGDGEHSLRSALDDLASNDPDALALLDAIFSSSGMTDLAAGYGDALESVEEGLDEDPPGKTSDVNIDDTALAKKMQFYTIAKLFGEEVIHPTANTFAETFGTAAGAAGLIVNVPFASQVSAIVALIDFVTNKIAIGLLPAKLTGFELEIPVTNLSPGEEVSALLRIKAKNDPPPTSLQDMVGLTLNLLGVAGGGQAESFKEVLENTAAFFLATMQQGLASYSEQNEGLNLDTNLFTIVSNMEWEALVDNPKLVDLISFSPEIVYALTDEVDWKTADNQIGSASIWAKTAGNDAFLLTLPPGFIYGAGAFGESVLATPTKQVTVSSELLLELDFAPTIEETGINALEARAGYEGTDGNTIWTPGIDIHLSLDGGTAQEETGVTDEDGQFITLIQHQIGFNQVIVSVTASDQFGQQVVKSVTATLGVGGYVTIVRGRVQMAGSVSMTVGEYGPGYAPESTSDNGIEDHMIEEPGSHIYSIALQRSLSHAPTGESANASTNAAFDLHISEGGGPGMTINGNADLSSSATFSGSSDGGAGGNSNVNMYVNFQIHDAPLSYAFTGSFNGSPRLVDLFGEFYHATLTDGEIPGSVTLSGSLSPGEYQLRIGQVSASASDPGGSSSAETDWNFSLQLGE